MKKNKLFQLIQAYYSNTSKNVLLYIFTSVFVGLLSLLTTTYLVNHLSQENYGQLELFLSVSALFTSLIMFGGSTFVIHYYNTESKKNEYEQAFSLVFFNTIVLFLICLPIIIIFETKLILFVILLLVYSCLNSIYNIVLTSYQLESKVSRYAIVTSSFSLATTLLTIGILFFFNHYLSRVFSLISICIVLLFIMYKPFVIDKIKTNVFLFTTVLKAYKTGISLTIGQIFSWVLEKFDRIIIISFLGPSLLAVYSLGYQFGMLMLLFQSAISKAWAPFLLKKIEKKNRLEIKNAIMKISFVYFAAVIIITFTGAIYVKYFVNVSYMNSIYIVPVVTLGYAFDGVWKLYNSILIIEKKYMLYTKQVIIIGAINMGLTFLFVKCFGIIGAAFSTLISFFIGFLWNYIYLEYNVKWFRG
jgi:O-antigen/teichoic acid export membrane protein